MTNRVDHEMHESGTKSCPCARIQHAPVKRRVPCWAMETQGPTETIDRTRTAINPDQMRVTVTGGNIATNLDRGSDPQTNTAARLVLTAVDASLWSRKNRFKHSLAAEKHSIVRTVRLLNCPPSSLRPPPPNRAFPAAGYGAGFQPKLSYRYLFSSSYQVGSASE